MPINTSMSREYLALWDFLCDIEIVNPSKYMIIMGSSELSFVKDAVAFFETGIVSNIVATGGNLYSEGLLESEYIAQVLEESHISSSKIILEKESTNTFENLKFSKILINDSDPSILVVHRPFCKMRAYLTALKIFPKGKVNIWAPHYSFNQYVHRYKAQDYLINCIVGEMYRLIMYPRLGFFDEIDIPNEIKAACDQLIAKGYNKNLIDISYNSYS